MNGLATKPNMTKPTVFLMAWAAIFLQHAAAVPTNEISFPMINNGTAGQWTLKLSIGSIITDNFVPVTCKTDVVGSCPNQPVLMQKMGQLLQLNYTLVKLNANNGTKLATFQGLTPTKIEGRLCYSAYSYGDRAWRKKNKPYPRLSQNCPRKFSDPAPFQGPVDSPTVKSLNSGSFVLNFNEEDEVPTATWFAMIWVYCGDQVCAAATTEAATPPAVNAAQAYVETQVEMGITSGMRAAAIILSIIGPSTFILFYLADSMHYKKTGRPLLLF